ncbi:tripartite tricarboxylate transporter TctB family protein [Vibrio rumoiensis]|uniref:Tripartite tricarboxylate transporter TctB family protein n=1 Tax=Vibrio rumoiensis 1S-45 TaxID=1188252 RepID=A0A1E5E5Z5_9VIBR|nr:tripartite tricarboxylate transporter TctB family protein [Vibrio rumoiensis]OEF29398.1 tripartite tricarboxylate transporter TctB family protein [Vibrio rumoiensis 1S-45]
MLNRNVVFPSIIIVLSAIAFAVITQFDSPMYQDSSVSAKFFPMAIVVAQIVICVLLLVQYKLKGDQSLQEAFISKMSIFGICFLIGYALLISVLGYLYASLAAFMFYLVYFKIKKPVYYVVAIIFVVAVNYLFGEVFYISLPQAMWL